MTNKEIDKLLDMLDKKSLEQIKNYLNKEKEKNIKKENQNTFEKYITNYDKDLAADAKSGTIFNEKEDLLVFSNGISLYYINKEAFNIDMKKVKDHFNHVNPHINHRIRIVNNETIKKYEDHLIEIADVDLNIEDLSDTFEYPLTIEYVDDFALVSYIKNDHLIEETFKVKEFKYADKLLKNPKYKICKNAPILYGESEIGKVYILGRKKKS